MTGEIPLYRALEPVSIRTRDCGLREFAVGDEFSFEGKPGAALLPLNGAARQNKLRAIVAGPGPHRPVDPVRQARGLGYVGNDVSRARSVIDEFIASETSRQSTPAT